MPLIKPRTSGRRATLALAVLAALAGLAHAEPAAAPAPKVGACPSGYGTSGAYCLASAGARHAVPKTGSCPSGYSTSGDYCLASR
jgi:uncharacterized membrane protein